MEEDGGTSPSPQISPHWPRTGVGSCASLRPAPAERPRAGPWGRPALTPAFASRAGAAWVLRAHSPQPPVPRSSGAAAVTSGGVAKQLRGISKHCRLEAAAPRLAVAFPSLRAPWAPRQRCRCGSEGALDRRREARVS